MVSGILQLITYHTTGGLCYEIFLKQISSKLDIAINVKNFIFPDFNFFFLFFSLILFVEACIRLQNSWKVKIDTVMFTICWWKRRNTVHPSTDQPSSEMLQTATYLNSYKVGPFLLMALCFLFFKVFGLLLNYNFVGISKVIMDCTLLGLPVYWVISSGEICIFIQLKYSQLRYRLGYF